MGMGWNVASPVEGETARGMCMLASSVLAEREDMLLH